MRVLVLGAGVIGTTTAYYLHRAGHEVVVLDRQPSAGLETSFANAGGVCPGFAGPWAAPGLPKKMLGWMFNPAAPVKLSLRPDRQQWRWLRQFLANCTAERFMRNKARMQRIAHYGKACLGQLRQHTGIQYDHGMGGVLQVFRTEEELEAAHRASKVLSSFGVEHRILDGPQLLVVEPGLSGSEVTFAGGLHLPGDETGDCHLFTSRLADRLKADGVEFRFDISIDALAVDGDTLDGVVAAGGERFSADAYVVALANGAPAILRQIGVHIPIYPVKGYSITIHLADEAHAPRSSVMDEHSKLMVSRLGRRLRAAGIADIGARSATIERKRADVVRDVARQLFPLAGDYARAEYWAGLRPMTPDGPLYLGRTPIRNLYLNIGHGSNGWTQSCGAARVVADVVGGQTPEIDLEGLTMEDRL